MLKIFPPYLTLGETPICHVARGILKNIFPTFLSPLRFAVFCVTARSCRTDSRLVRKRWAWQRSLFDRGMLLLECGCADLISWSTSVKRLEIERIGGVCSIVGRGERTEVQISVVRRAWTQERRRNRSACVSIHFVCAVLGLVITGVCRVPTEPSYVKNIGRLDTDSLRYFRPLLYSTAIVEDCVEVYK